MPAGVKPDHWGISIRRFAPGVAMLCLLAACTRPPPAHHPHYVLGAPYQAGGIWWYPRENYDLDETGLAAIYPDHHAPLTTDGEVFSQNAIAVAQPTLQLPAIARLTDLQTGRSLLVRINDRGNPSPGRLVQVTRRVATLLGMPRGSVAQVRLAVLAGPSAAAEDRVDGAPHLAIATAPLGRVQQVALPPPPGIRQASGHRTPPAAPPPPAPAKGAEPLRIDGIVAQGSPDPGRLWVRLNTFQSYQYAAIQRARVVGLSPHIQTVSRGRTHVFRVVLGPFTRVTDADAALDRAIAAGVSDARIVID